MYPGLMHVQDGCKSGVYRLQRLYEKELIRVITGCRAACSNA